MIDKTKTICPPPPPIFDLRGIKHWLIFSLTEGFKKIFLILTYINMDFPNCNPHPWDVNELDVALSCKFELIWLSGS
jgi:hypothetical protein